MSPDIARYFELLGILSARTIKTRYRGSIIGVFWSLGNPIMMTGVYALVFGTAFSSYYNHSILSYIFATFVGLAVLNIFSQTTSQALVSVVGNGGLLNKLRLPMSIFPMSFVASNFFQFFVGTMPVLILITIIKSRSPLNVIALAIPCASLLGVVIGFSMLTSAIYVYFRDLPYMYEIVLFFIWMTSPIFYPAELVPAKIQPYLEINPLIFIVESFRQIALSHQPPDFALAAKSLVSGALFLILGTFLFETRKRDFMDLL